MSIQLVPFVLLVLTCVQLKERLLVIFKLEMV